MKTFITLILFTFTTCFSAFTLAQPVDDAKQTVTTSQMVSINNANTKQLSSLRGIGSKKAQAIVTYREQNGAFKTVDGLLKVKGIGHKILSDNKQRLKM